MKGKPYTSLNPFFLLPFCLWVVTGGVLQLLFTQEQLFKTVNIHYSSLGDVVMYGATYMGQAEVIVLALLLLLGISSLRNWWYFLTAILCNIVPNIIIQIIKTSVAAGRPLKYFQHTNWIHTLDSWPKHLERSFPSGHTTAAFCFFTFLAFLLPPKHRWLGSVLFLLALLVGYSRMYLAVHFFADVYVGSVIGTTFTAMIMLLMNSKKEQLVKSKY